MAKKKVEYQHQGEWWSIEKWKQLNDWIPDAEETNLGTLHVVGLTVPQSWAVARRIFGINPVNLMGTNLDAERMEPITLKRLAEETDKEVAQLKILLDLLEDAFVRKLEEIRIASLNVQAPVPLPPPVEIKPEVKAAPKPAAPEHQPHNNFYHAGDLTEQELGVLVSFGFDVEMFKMDYQRPTSVVNMEARWFIERLKELERLFIEPLVKSLARQAITNELLLRRLDYELLRTPAVTDRFWQLQEKKVKLEEIYAKQWEQIESLCPQFKSAKNRAAILGLLSDLIGAYKEFKSQGTNHIADGIFTALELQVELRTSKQAEDAYGDDLGSGVRYRPGWVAAVNEARAGTFDPKFRRMMPNGVLQCLDEGFRKGYMAMLQKLGLPVVDLMDQSEAGEYDPIFIPEEVTESPVEKPKPKANADMPEPGANIEIV